MALISMLMRASPSPTALLSTVTAGTETYTHSSLTNGTTYYYRISAVDNAGNESSKSSDVSSSPYAVYTVKTDGTGDYTTIQAAINATASGDTVLVYPGTYTENIDYVGKNLVIQSKVMVEPGEKGEALKTDKVRAKIRKIMQKSLD